MRGDIIDAKQLLKSLLEGDVFADQLQALVAEKSSAGIAAPNPTVTRAVTVYTNERLTKLVFPMAELLAYSSIYTGGDSLAKEATHKIGVRWTALEKDEATATLSSELLCIATVDFLWNESNQGLLPGGGAIGACPIIIDEEDYSPLLPDLKGAFIKSGVVVVQLTTIRTNNV